MYNINCDVLVEIIYKLTNRSDILSIISVNKSTRDFARKNAFRLCKLPIKDVKIIDDMFHNISRRNVDELNTVIRNGNPTIVNLLLKSKVRPNVRSVSLTITNLPRLYNRIRKLSNVSWDQMLKHSIKNHNMKMFNKSVSMVDDPSKYILTACNYRNHDVIQELIVTLKDHQLQDTFDNCIRYNNIQAVQTLLQSDIMIKSSHVRLAAQSGYYDIIDILVSYDNKYANIAAESAAYAGQNQIVSNVIQHVSNRKKLTKIAYQTMNHELLRLL